MTHKKGFLLFKKRPVMVFVFNTCPEESGWRLCIDFEKVITQIPIRYDSRHVFQHR